MDMDSLKTALFDHQTIHEIVYLLKHGQTKNRR